MSVARSVYWVPPVCWLKNVTSTSPASTGMSSTLGVKPHAVRSPPKAWRAMRPNPRSGHEAEVGQRDGLTGGDRPGVERGGHRTRRGDRAHDDRLPVAHGEDRENTRRA